MNEFQNILKGGDLRSIGKANEIVALVNNQAVFDELFEGLNCSDRKVVMRTADAIEKITLKQSAYLQKHKTALLRLFRNTKDIELKWHLALLVSRISLTGEELKNTWHLLTRWARDGKESKIVRVNSIQGLFNLLPQQPGLLQEFNLTVSEIGKEKIASLNARIRKLQNTSL